VKKKLKNIKDLMKWASNYLALKKVENPHLVAEIIAEYITNKQRINLHLEPNLYLTREKESLFKKNIRKCGRKIPLAYVTGEQYFMGHRFLIKPGVFIPRPETEILVEKALQFLERIKKKNCQQPIIVADIGTGSGNIAISIAKQIKNAFIYATDISELALAVAKDNAQAHEVYQQINFLLGSLFSPLKNRKLETKIDLVISNPPYIEKEQMRYLPKEVKKEPEFALDGGKNGLIFYEKIIPTSLRWLKKNGALMFEIGYSQSERIKQIIHKSREYQGLSQIFYDLASNPRIISVQKI